MGGIPTGDKPTPTPGSKSVAAKQKRAQKERERFEEARRRYNITRYYLEELSDESYRGATPLIEEAIEEGKFEGPAPSYATLWRWVDDYKEAEENGRVPGILDFVAQPSSGRDRKPIHPVVDDFLRGWMEHTSTLTDGQLEHRTRALAERERLIGSLEGVVTFMAGDEMPPVDPVGEAGTASLQELQPLLEHATDLLGLELDRAQGLIERVRRFPPPEAPGHERFGSADKNPLSRVDRLEAIEAIYELFSVPRARSLISEARRLLGHVLRDVELLQDLLDELAPRPGFPRGVLIVALGLLGEPVAFERAVPDGSDPDAARAWVLAVILREMDRGEGPSCGASTGSVGSRPSDDGDGPTEAAQWLFCVGNRMTRQLCFAGWLRRPTSL